MPKIFLPAKKEEVEKGLDFIQKTLEKYRIKGKSKLEAMLVSEESMLRLIENASPEADMQISIRRWYSTATISISAQGSEFAGDALDLGISMPEMGHDSEEAIRSMLLHAYADKLAYSRKGNYNFVKISAGDKEKVFAIRTIAAFIAAVIAAMLSMFFLPESVRLFISAEILSPIQEIFLNALQLVTAPAVFFSIMTSISRYTSYSDPGRVSTKILGGYAVTSLIAVGIGVSVFVLCSPLIESSTLLNQLFVSDISSAQVTDVRGLIKEFVPDNIIAPFLNTNAAQLLVIAVVGGLALGRAGQFSARLVEMADALDSFFLSCVNIVSGLIPAAVFFVTLLMIFSFGPESVISAGVVLLLVAAGLAVMFLVYLLIILFIGRLDPIVFIKKYFPDMKAAFLKGSSIGSIGDTMRCCEKKLGISPKVCSFSIPFGAISNLDGNCVYLTVAGLFLARICGVDILGRDLFTVAAMVLIMSIGSPITPGSALLAMTMLLSQMNISISVISLIIGVNSVIELILAACNTAGDVAISLAAARTEGLVDKEIYSDMKLKNK